MERRWKDHATGLKTKDRITFHRVDASGRSEVREEEIICEKEMEVSVNGSPAFRLTCTPEHLQELVLGRLMTEGLIRSIDEVEHLFICGEGNIGEVQISGEPVFRPYGGAEPTCCTGNLQLTEREDRREPEKLTEMTPDMEEVFRLAEHFRKDGELHRSTGGTHSCYIRLPEGEILSFEDIGRHNALDKAVGAMLSREADPGKCMLFTTGRVAADMVMKTVTAGIPVLVSKAVPTDRAVRLAGKYGLTLIFRAWPDSFCLADHLSEPAE